MVIPAGADDVQVIDVGDGPGDPRAAWERVLRQDPSLPWAAPVLLDEDGREMLPTGEVTVRFGGPPSDADLGEFGRRHGLSLRSRNEFVPSQAVFVPADRRSAYLPDLCQRLAGEPGVAAAWANTRSRYERT